MIQRQRSITLLLGALLALGTAQSYAQQVYKVTDKEGNVSFTDRPPGKDSGLLVEPVQLKGINTSEPPPTRSMPVPTPAEQKEKINYSTEITSPEDGTTIPMGGGIFGVGAQISPRLAPGEKLQLTLDGSPIGEPQVSTTWQLNNVFRGEHSISVERLSAAGKVLHRATPITVFVLRPGRAR